MKSLKPIDTPHQYFMEAQAPPSKAHTLRAIFLAALAEGTTVVRSPLMGEDQVVALECIRTLGAEFFFQQDTLVIKGIEQGCITPRVTVDCHESGLSARVLIAIATVLNRAITITGDLRLQSGRPVSDTVDCLRDLGYSLIYHNKEGFLPVQVIPTENILPKRNTVSISMSNSSQHLTAILMIAPLLNSGLSIWIQGAKRSLPYIAITIDMMKQFCADVTVGKDMYRIQPQKYQPTHVTIEGDFSSAAFFAEAAALTGGTVRISGLNPESNQGDKVFFDVLKKMGCTVFWDKHHLSISGKPHRPIHIDMKDAPDIVMPLSVIMATVPGEHRILNVSHLRVKESDRLHATAINLERFGVEVEEGTDFLVIHGSLKLRSNVVIESFNDHRIAMSFALLGLLYENISIDLPDCVNKSFPNFWHLFD